MTDPIDLKKLAANYVDLWQEHLAAVGKDEDTAEIMAKTMALMTTGAATFANTMAEAANSSPVSGDPQSDPQKSHGKTATNTPQPDPTAGAPASALPPERPAPDIDSMLGRIAALEERVAQLERKNVPTRASKVRSRKRP